MENNNRKKKKPETTVAMATSRQQQHLVVVDSVGAGVTEEDRTGNRSKKRKDKDSEQDVTPTGHKTPPRKRKHQPDPLYTDQTVRSVNVEENQKRTPQSSNKQPVSNRQRQHIVQEIRNRQLTTPPISVTEPASASGSSSGRRRRRKRARENRSCGTPTSPVATSPAATSSASPAAASSMISTTARHQTPPQKLKSKVLPSIGKKGELFL